MSKPRLRAKSAARSEERRRTPRFEALGRLLGTLMPVDLPVRVRDVGLGGFSVETMEPIEAGDVHAVRFTAIDDWTAVLAAESLHCRPSVAADGSPRYVTGFSFVTEQVQDAAAIIRALVTKVTTAQIYDEPTTE